MDQLLYNFHIKFTTIEPFNNNPFKHLNDLTFLSRYIYFNYFNNLLCNVLVY